MKNRNYLNANLASIKRRTGNLFPGAIPREINASCGTSLGSERGSVLIETAFSLFFLITCAVLIYDTAGIISAQIFLSHAAYEGGRLGAGIPNLSADPDNFLHRFIETRVRSVLNESSWLRISDTQVRSQCVAIAVDPPESMPIVQVEVSARYRALLMPFAGRTLVGSHGVVYLAGRVCS